MLEVKVVIFDGAAEPAEITEKGMHRFENEEPQGFSKTRAQNFQRAVGGKDATPLAGSKPAIHDARVYHTIIET